MHILIPGGAGYVGSRLIPALLQKGYQVTVLDLYLYGRDIFKEYQSHPNLREIPGDVRDLNLVKEAMRGG